MHFGVFCGGVPAGCVWFCVSVCVCVCVCVCLYVGGRAVETLHLKYQPAALLHPPPNAKPFPLTPSSESGQTGSHLHTLAPGAVVQSWYEGGWGFLEVGKVHQNAENSPRTHQPGCVMGHVTSAKRCGLPRWASCCTKVTLRMDLAARMPRPFFFSLRTGAFLFVN